MWLAAHRTGRISWELMLIERLDMATGKSDSAAGPQ